MYQPPAMRVSPAGSAFPDAGSAARKVVPLRMLSPANIALRRKSYRRLSALLAGERVNRFLERDEQHADFAQPLICAARIWARSG